MEGGGGRTLVLEDQEGLVWAKRVPIRNHKLRGGNHIDDTSHISIYKPPAASIYEGWGDGVSIVGCNAQARTARGTDILCARDIIRWDGSIRGELAGEDHIVNAHRNRRHSGIGARYGTIR